MNNQKVPKIRFKGFSGDWEQRKLGDISTSYSGGTPTAGKDEYYGGIIPFIRSGEISSDHTELFLTERGFNSSSAVMVKQGDILYALYGATSGEVSISKLNGAINQAILAVLPNDGYDTDFIMQWLRKSKDSIVSTYLQGGQGNLSATIVNQLHIDLPSYNEQRRIGAFFKVLDNNITLHQSKLDKLKIIKKSMLENCFPKNGENVPKFRFSGFTGDWEQCKLGETFTLLQNNTLSRAELNEEKGVAKNVHYGDVLIKLSECLDLSKESLPFIEQQSVVDKFKNASLQNGDVVVADTAEDETVGKSTEIMGITDEKVISGLHTIPLRPIQQFSTGYLGYYFNSPSYHDQLKPHMQGIKVTSISKGAILGTVIKFPSDLKEQEQIGRFFLGLDHLITLHQSKLDKLKVIKKTLLESMFV